MADAFAALETRPPGDRQPGTGADWAPGHPVRLRDLRAGLSNGEDVRLRELALGSRRALYREEGLYLRFAAAWGWAHFLRAREPARLDRYLAAVRGGASREEAFAAAFGDVADLVDLESRWRAHVLGLKIP
jgi:hypothetical protein